MRTIWEFFQRNKALCRKTGMHESDIYPIDKMNMNPILSITHPDFVAALQRGTEKEKEAGIYLANLRFYFDLWNSNKAITYPLHYDESFTHLTPDDFLDDLLLESTSGTPAIQPSTDPPPSEQSLTLPLSTIDITTLIEQLQHVVKYFQHITTGNSDVTSQMEVTVKSLQQLHNYLQKYNYTLQAPSILSTLVVENFFSQIRRKIRYPNYYEYCYLMRRARNEIIKQNAKDYLFPVRQARVGKKYNNQEGVEFSVDDIEYVSRKNKKGKYKEIQGKNTGKILYLLSLFSYLIIVGDLQQKQLAKELVELFPCSRQRLLIREITCKANPLNGNASIITTQ